MRLPAARRVRLAALLPVASRLLLAVALLCAACATSEVRVRTAQGLEERVFVSGFVVDARTSAALETAVVIGQAPSLLRDATVATDDRGRFAVALPRGPVRLVVERSGHEPVRLLLDIGSNGLHGLQIKLAPLAEAERVEIRVGPEQAGKDEKKPAIEPKAERGKTFTRTELDLLPGK